MADLGSGISLPGSASTGDTFFLDTDQREYVWLVGAWHAIPELITRFGPQVSLLPTLPASAGLGQAVLALDTGRLSVWDGVAWHGIATT